jgi:hypothetical protein
MFYRRAKIKNLHNVARVSYAASGVGNRKWS